jgi:hypothetical protein
MASIAGVTLAGAASMRLFHLTTGISVKQVAALIWSLRGLKMAMIGTGVGALIVGLGTLAAAVVTVRTRMKETGTTFNTVLQRLPELAGWTAGRIARAFSDAFQFIIDNFMKMMKQMLPIMFDFATMNLAGLAIRLAKAYPALAEDMSKKFGEGWKKGWDKGPMPKLFDDVKKKGKDAAEVDAFKETTEGAKKLKDAMDKLTGRMGPKEFSLAVQDMLLARANAARAKPAAGPAAARGGDGAALGPGAGMLFGPGPIAGIGLGLMTSEKAREEEGKKLHRKRRIAWGLGILWKPEWDLDMLDRTIRGTRMDRAIRVSEKRKGVRRRAGIPPPGPTAVEMHEVVSSSMAEMFPMMREWVEGEASKGGGGAAARDKTKIGLLNDIAEEEETMTKWLERISAGVDRIRGVPVARD